MNDVVLAMCSGAMRTYLLELDALPDAPLVSMVPVGLKAKESHVASAVRRQRRRRGDGASSAPTWPTRPTGCRPSTQSMADGKRGARRDDAGADPGDERARPGAGDPRRRCCGCSGLVRPPYNLIISNVPGPRTTQYFNGARLDGHLPAVDPDRRHGAQHHLQLLRRPDGLRADRLPAHGPAPAAPADHLDAELGALEKAAGL